jgi:hypothetical protein
MKKLMFLAAVMAIGVATVPALTRTTVIQASEQEVESEKRHVRHARGLRLLVVLQRSIVARLRRG